ncbi:MAG: glycosyltransferase family 4 protein [Bacteroidales bacterium]|nr:glycosyltransferase family 4 protein [Bacteroidales bacterium]
MNILVLHNKLPYPPKDGGSIAVLEFCLEMAQQSNSVTLLCMNTKKHFYPISQIPGYIVEKIRIIAVDVDSNIKPFSLLVNFLFSKKPYHCVRFSSKEFEKTLLNEIRSTNYDFILYEGLFVLPYIKANPQHFSVYRAHNIESEIWHRVASNEKNIFKKWYLRSLANRLENFERKIINKPNIVLTLTQRDESLLKTMGCKKLMYVSKAGIPISEHSYQKHLIEFPSIFFIGALDWLPNQEGLIWFLRTIWQKLHVLNPHLMFDVAGRNAPLWLQQKIKEYPNVRFFGEIDDAKKFMQQRAIMVVPLFSGSGIRIKILEGMSLGKTIVTTSIGAEGIPALHLNHILIADSQEQFLDSIQQLLNDKSLFEKIGQQAYEFVKQHYNITTIVSHTLTYIEKVKSLHDKNHKN